MTTLVIIAKQPIPGMAKTRLHPPLSLEQAAEIAAASLDDTLSAMAALPATRRVLFYQGDLLPAGSEGYDVIPQTSGTLDERLGDLFDAVDGPTVLIGMDTPQVTAADLLPAFAGWPHDLDAWFGPAEDGGWWALGLRDPRGDLLRGVPMSRDDTGARTLARLRAAGLSVGLLPTLRDVDYLDDARLVAQLAPRTTFASTLAAFERDLLLSGSTR